MKGEVSAISRSRGLDKYTLSDGFSEYNMHEYFAE